MVRFPRLKHVIELPTRRLAEIIELICTSPFSSFAVTVHDTKDDHVYLWLSDVSFGKVSAHYTPSVLYKDEVTW